MRRYAMCAGMRCAPIYDVRRYTNIRRYAMCAGSLEIAAQLPSGFLRKMITRRQNSE